MLAIPSSGAGAVPNAWLAFGSIFMILDSLPQPYYKAMSLVLLQLVILLLTPVGGLSNSKQKHRKSRLDRGRREMREGQREGKLR